MKHAAKQELLEFSGGCEHHREMFTGNLLPSQQEPGGLKTPLF